MQHEKKAIYTFRMHPVAALIYNGPAKSMPTLANTGTSFTLNSSSAAVWDVQKAHSSCFLQVMHLLNTFFTHCLPFWNLIPQNHFCKRHSHMAVQDLSMTAPYHQCHVSMVSWENDWSVRVDFLFFFRINQSSNTSTDSIVF